jgi:hypothetical protein
MDMLLPYTNIHTLTTQSPICTHTHTLSLSHAPMYSSNPALLTLRVLVLSLGATGTVVTSSVLPETGASAVVWIVRPNADDTRRGLGYKRECV